MLTAQPLLNLLGPFPPARLQLCPHLALHAGRRPAPMGPRQQLLDTPRFERPDPVEELTAADAHLLGNVGGGELAAAGQAHGQQTLLVADVLAGGDGIVSALLLYPLRAITMQ